MVSLQKLQVEDWAKFAQGEDTNLACQRCHGMGMVGRMHHECPDCDGEGSLIPIWNTIWNTGYGSIYHGKLCGKKLPVKSDAGGVIIFEHEGQVWFGLSGCGMDMTPMLAAAWVEAFPSCTWLPDDFMVRGVNLTQGYIEACVGPQWAKRIYALMRKSAGLLRSEARSIEEELKQARALLRTREAERKARSA